MNIQKMMQQAQQMQENLQKQLKQTKVEATAGGGMVTVVMNGVKEIQSLTIDPEVVSRSSTRLNSSTLISSDRAATWSTICRAGRQVSQPNVWVKKTIVTGVARFASAASRSASPPAPACIHGLWRIMVEHGGRSTERPPALGRPVRVDDETDADPGAGS